MSSADTMCLLFNFCQNALKVPRGSPRLSGVGWGEKVLTGCYRGAAVNEKHSVGFI